MSARIVSALIFSFVGTACSNPPAQIETSQTETPTESALNAPYIVEGLSIREDTAGLALPEGFQAELIYEIGQESRELIIRGDGDMFVSLSGKRFGPHIVGLRDTDGDHQIDVRTDFFEVITPDEQKVPRIHIDYADEHLYAVTNEQVIRMPLPAGALEPTGPEEVIIASIPYQSSHRGRTITIGPDNWVYVNIGSPSNACQQVSKTLGSPGKDPCEERELHAGIWRWPTDKLNQSRDDGELYGLGIRNTIAQAWDPKTGHLYSAQMGRDRLDSLWPEQFTPEQNADLPGEEFFRVEQGKDYGWPYCYWDGFQNKKVLAPEYGGDGQIVGRCADMEPPLLAFPAHHSPSSIAFYPESDALPAHYHEGAFVALKGSWNRAPIAQGGYSVVFVPFENGEATGDWELFASGFTGFETLYERGNAVYRPQYIAVHPDGSLYILDNNEGRIWRITYSGQNGALIPSPLKKTDRDLITLAALGDGGEIYQQYCAACHQSGGGGVPGQFPPLTNTDWVSGDKGRLIRSVLHGMQGPVIINGEMYDEIMPGHAFLDDEEMAALLTYVRKTFGEIDDPILESEVTLVRNSDQRETPWPAPELETRTGLIISSD